LRVALVGMGLIGGSIGLAARHRLGAHVVACNRSPAPLQTALEMGAIDEAVASVMDIGETDIAIACVSVDALPGAVRNLCAALPRAVVTDVGSTKQALVDSVEASNFIGGHPLAGAEATGVAHARENLFDGATWYLTPRAQSPGVLYERLARFVAGVGAVPSAITPDEHDRLMAAVSHLPHVIANLLVAQATEALGDTLPATGPSFRDATRVAGSNPALWAQIYSANRAALGAEIDDLVRRLGDVRAWLDGGDLETWQRAAGSQRHALLEVGLGGADGPLREIRASVPNKPGVVAEIALALGRAGINIADMSLTPEADNRTGLIALWVGAADVARATGLVSELGYPAAS